MDKGRVAFAAVLALIAAGAIVLALPWPPKARLFPLVVAVPLLVLALCQLVVAVRGRGAAPDDETTALPADVTPASARARTRAVFGWMAAFIALVALIGFPVTVPVFVGAYLAFTRATTWPRAAVAALVAWLCFHAVFERILHLPFEPGLVHEWLASD